MRMLGVLDREVVDLGTGAGCAAAAHGSARGARSIRGAPRAAPSHRPLRWRRRPPPARRDRRSRRRRPVPRCRIPGNLGYAPSCPQGRYLRRELSAPALLREASGRSGRWRRRSRPTGARGRGAAWRWPRLLAGRDRLPRHRQAAPERACPRQAAGPARPAGQAADRALSLSQSRAQSGRRRRRGVEAPRGHRPRHSFQLAKLDRLSRNAAFLLTLRDSGVRFAAVDLPEANDLTVGDHGAGGATGARGDLKAHQGGAGGGQEPRCSAGQPQWRGGAEAGRQGRCAARAAIARNADRHAQDLAPVVEDIRAGGATSLREIAAELNARGMLTRRGGRWHVSTVTNLLDRLGQREAPCTSPG